MPGGTQWLGSTREKNIADLQRKMAQTDDGVEKVILSRLAKKERFGDDAATFGLSVAELSIPRIGVF